MASLEYLLSDSKQHNCSTSTHSLISYQVLRENVYREVQVTDHLTQPHRLLSGQGRLVHYKSARGE